MGSRSLVFLLLLVSCVSIGAQCAGAKPKKFYWFNSVSGVTQWEEPPQWEFYGDDGKAYYLNEDGEKVYDKPDKYAWKELASDQHDGAKYYHNELTGVYPPCLLAFHPYSEKNSKYN
eukprot:jgi/Botrbrau1/4416/Bobra.0348s0008.2